MFDFDHTNHFSLGPFSMETKARQKEEKVKKKEKKTKTNQTKSLWSVSRHFRGKELKQVDNLGAFFFFGIE